MPSHSSLQFTPLQYLKVKHSITGTSFDLTGQGQGHEQDDKAVLVSQSTASDALAHIKQSFITYLTSSNSLPEVKESKQTFHNERLTAKRLNLILGGLGNMHLF